jgi:hypothetical protein
LLWGCCGVAVGLLWGCCGVAVGLLWGCTVGTLWGCHHIRRRSHRPTELCCSPPYLLTPAFRLVVDVFDLLDGEWRRDLRGEPDPQYPRLWDLRLSRLQPRALQQPRHVLISCLGASRAHPGCVTCLPLGASRACPEGITCSLGRDSSERVGRWRWLRGELIALTFPHRPSWPAALSTPSRWRATLDRDDEIEDRLYIMYMIRGRSNPFRAPHHSRPTAAATPQPPHHSHHSCHTTASTPQPPHHSHHSCHTTAPTPQPPHHSHHSCHTTAPTPQPPHHSHHSRHTIAAPPQLPHHSHHITAALGNT